MSRKFLLSKFLRCFVICVGVLLAAVAAVGSLTPCLAEPKEDIPRLDDTPPTLPPSTAGGVTPLTVGASQSTQFKKSLLPEVYPLVRSGVIELEALARTRFDWSLGKAWEAKAPQEKRAEDFLPEDRLVKGVPFVVSVNGSQGKSSPQMAGQILWNGIASQWSFPVSRQALSFFWYKQGQFQREVQAEVARLYPALVPGVTSGIQLFREKFTVTSPPTIATLAYLTFRFLGPDEDLLWGFSPAIAKTRQLTGANRSDPLLQMPLSLDDLFIWSGKRESVDAALQSEQEALVPVAGIDLEQLAPGSADGCASLSEPGTKPGVDLIARWATEGRSAWSIFSSMSYFVPRKVWRIELMSNDPFSLYGRQILTVDQELMVPLVKLVYDRSGHPWKLVMGSVGIAELKDGGRRVITYPLTIVHDYLKDETVVVQSMNLEVCDTLGAIDAATFGVKEFAGENKAEPEAARPAKG